MIVSGELKDREIAQIAQCTSRTIRRHRANLTCFGSTTAPQGQRGRRPLMTSEMLSALCEHLLKKPDEDLDGMILFLWDEFGQLLSRWSVRRALSSANWSPKTMRRVAKGRNADVRDYYEHVVSEFPSWYRLYVDESGCDSRIGFRRGWAPVGVTPEKVVQFPRGQRYQILPAYDQDGVVFFRVFQGSTDAAFFLEFMEQLLPHCNPFPGKRSVIIMDNASIHRGPEIEAVCARVGVKLVYLPPYSPDKNPIEEFFAELKAFIKKHWMVFEANPEYEFKAFLEWCVDEVGGREASARGHFRNAGVTIQEHDGQ
jgi:transposase